MKHPPVAKVYEALTAIASNRIELNSDHAIVYSSDNKKSYQIKWNETEYTSNDNATYWQGYPGYPVIAVLMLQGKLSYNEEILPYLKDINWHELNEQYKRNYDEAILNVLKNLEPETQENIKESVEYIYKQLINLDIKIVKKLSN